MQDKNTDTKLIISIIIVFVLVAGVIAYALSRPAKNDASAIKNNSSTTMEPTTAKEKGEAFLVANAKLPGVVVLPSGLQYKILTTGTGPKPSPSQTVKVNYEGTLIDGTIFDSSYKRGEPIEFGVTQVIPGWVEGLQLMPVGSTWMFYIPSDLAYGQYGAGGAIGPDETLIFKVELLGAHN